LDEWLPVVKKNREKEHLDFSQDLGLNEFRMQAKAHDQKKSKLTAFESILADKLQSLGIAKEADLIKKESELIKSKDLDTNGLSTSIAESESAAARTRQLYGELKAKRQAKIKSKVYRAIKKRERNKLASKQADLAEGNSDEEAKEADRDRAQERLTLRHRNKTKFTDQLKRYANQKEVQKMYSDLNKERQKILKKIDMDVYAELASDDSDYEQEELDTKAIADIEAAFEDDTKEGPSDDIVAELARRGRENMRQEAEKLIASIKGEEGIKAEGRQKFKREEKLVEEKKKDVVHLAQAESGLELLKRMNREENGDLGKRESQSGLPGIAIDSKVNLPNKKVKQAAVNLKEDLLEGIEIGALKEKYKKSSKGKTFKEEDMEAFRLENEEDEYLGGHEQVVMAGKENVQEFEQEKEDELMKEVVEEKKPLKGWGDWTGAGIVERKVDPEVELEKKRQQIVD
jgi:U3 small nucleolar RNA-associated protein 14